jgi:hypothetical protein
MIKNKKARNRSSMDEQLNTQIIKKDKALNAALLKQDLYNVLSNPAGQCQCQYRRKKN